MADTVDPQQWPRDVATTRSCSRDVSYRYEPSNDDPDTGLYARDPKGQRRPKSPSGFLISTSGARHTPTWHQPHRVFACWIYHCAISKRSAARNAAQLGGDLPHGYFSASLVQTYLGNVA